MSESWAHPLAQLYNKVIQPNKDTVRKDRRLAQFKDVINSLASRKRFYIIYSQTMQLNNNNNKGVSIPFQICTF